MALQAIGISKISALHTRHLPRILYLKLISHFIFDDSLFILTIVILCKRLTSPSADTESPCSYLVIHYYLIIISLLPSAFRDVGFWGFGEIGRASCRERVS